MRSDWNKFRNVTMPDGETNPCTKDCPERSDICHGQCGRYKRFEKARFKESEKRAIRSDAYVASLMGMRKNKAMRAKKKYGY